jgi:hypothetical protein
VYLGIGLEEGLEHLGGGEDRVVGQTGEELAQLTAAGLDELRVEAVYSPPPPQKTRKMKNERMTGEEGDDEEEREKVLWMMVLSGRGGMM